MRCAFYEKEITPPLGSSMPGYFEVRLAEDVDDRLYAKAVVLENDDNITAILAIDACYILAEMCDKIVERVSQATGIDGKNIMICANHTHYAGPICLLEYQLPDKAYMEMLVKLAADCIILAYKRLDKTSVKYGKGYIDTISFNRNYVMKNGNVETNPGVLNPNIVKPYAGIDPDVPVLFFTDEDGIPKGLITCFACHQACRGPKKAYSGDYSSILAKELKKVYGYDFVSVFLSGTAGNINHINVNKRHEAGQYIRMGKILSEEIVKTADKAEKMSNEALASRKEYIKLKKRKASKEEYEEAKYLVENEDKIVINDKTMMEVAKVKMARCLLEYCKGQDDDANVCVQVMRIGDCVLYCLPGELFVQFGDIIKEKMNSEKYVIASLCNGFDGYIPTRELFVPTIYESRLSVSSFLEPEAGYIIAEKALELAENI